MRFRKFVMVVNKYEKTLSLLLAIMVLMSILVIPAAAAMSESDVDPRATAVKCAACASETYETTVSEMRPVTVASCQNGVLFTHGHSKEYSVTYLVCRSETCGLRVERSAGLTANGKDICLY